MKTVGIVAEYNPCHKGHIYHIEQSKIQSKADATVVVMSGNFVQRGVPAIADKYTRAKWALQSGADLVIEIPTVFSCASAEYFARGSVAILHYLGVDAMAFGMESGQIQDFDGIVHTLLTEPEAYRELLGSYLTKGFSAPLARQHALTEYLKDDMASSLISSPNNILAIEYLKALKELDSHMIPYGIRRYGSGYHDEAFTGIYPSATAVRNMCKDGDFASIEEALHPMVARDLKEQFGKHFPLYAEDSLSCLHYALLMNKNNLERYQDMDAHLTNRVHKLLEKNDFLDYDSLILALKSKNITYTRVSRALLHVLLDIRKEELFHWGQDLSQTYARVLGFNETGKKVLNGYRKTSGIPILTKAAHCEELLGETALSMYRKDILAQEIYRLLVHTKYGTTIQDEFRSRPIIL